MTQDKLDKLTPVHSGEVLLEEFFKPMNLIKNALIRTYHFLNYST